MKETRFTLVYRRRPAHEPVSASGFLRSTGVRRVKDAISATIHYVMILSLSFVFLYPMLYMISQSFMTGQDVADALVQWIPKSLKFDNFIFAFNSLSYMKHFKNSVILSLGGALLQLFGCALAGYGFARYRFPGYTLLMVLLLFTFLVPPQSIVVPLFLLFSDLKMMNTYLPLLVPNFFGHGLRGALFVLVYMQFFRGLPHQLEEAAKIDGAGPWRTFISIMVPLAKPAILVVFLFSIVWHWNDSFFPNLYLNKSDTFTLNQKLGTIEVTKEKDETGMKQDSKDVIGELPTNHEKLMAGAFLTILPILLLYLFTQRYFVESVERTGIAGE
ncbi:carbohydrate ABC transporter permease [Paenibacillus contaminans]|uniref:Carbohydrate ABC transporter permease n=1 Tax=Paenibacillus contaminans TaxID=450362 RepID=A0A329MM38_9BACL|nr:carbohydrate ABC transporter permease [Paenibacillus contaminans]RAV20670.1 carbohydrate ABC transporter permease [Paenibacillus contaminans]